MLYKEKKGLVNSYKTFAKFRIDKLLEINQKLSRI